MRYVPVIEFDEASHKYTVDGVEFPSVTKILGVLNRPALPWWGQQVGVRGIQHLYRQGVQIPWDDDEGMMKLLTEHRLTVNHVRDTAGTRGQSLHLALEQWTTRERVANPADFPVEDRGYVQALARALIALNPTVLASEVMVASVTHGFAGRYDLRADIAGVPCLLELKTGKKVYPDTQFPQLEAYAAASEEMGEPPTAVRYVVRLGADGEFEVAKSCATFEDFLAVKSAFDAIRRIKSALPRKRRAKVAA